MNLMKATSARASCLVLSLALYATTWPAFAQESPDEEYSGEIETVIVVGYATNSVVTVADIESYQANDLADIFRLTPSISVGGSNGIAQKIYIRGIEDALINVTVDGAPQTSTLFHHIGRVQIDPNLLKQVEVQAGAGEATSGAGAVGGSIRFRTKDINDLLDASRSFGGTFRAGAFTNDGEQYSASLYGRLGESWGILGYYNYVDRDNMEDGDGVELDGTAAEQTLAYVKISGDIGENQRLAFSYESRNEEGQFTRWPNWSPNQGAPLYSGEGDRSTFVGNYHLDNGELLNLDVTGYHTESGFQRDLFTWFTDITTFGADIRNTSELGKHTITYGFEMRSDEVASGEIGVPTQFLEDGTVMGFYAQAHSQLTDTFLLSYGARWDSYDFEQKKENVRGNPLASVDNSEVSLNAGFVYDFADDWSFSLGYAEASRGMQVSDGFTSWGLTVDPGLESEKVGNIEAALEYSTEHFNVQVAVFRSEIDNVIHDQSSGAVYYENYGKVETDGFEVDMAYRWRNVELFLGYSHSLSELDPAESAFSVDYGKIELEGYEHSGLGNNRGNTWNFTISYSPRASINLGWNVNYVQDLNSIEVLYRSVDLGWIDRLQYIDKPSHMVHDAFAEWIPHDKFRINLAITNVFDKTYLDHSSPGDYTHIPDWEVVRGYNEAGRDVRLSATLSF